MQTYESRKQGVWDCRYHVVFIPKCRRKMLYVQLRRQMGLVFRSLACAACRGVQLAGELTVRHPGTVVFPVRKRNVAWAEQRQAPKMKMDPER